MWSQYVVGARADCSRTTDLCSLGHAPAALINVRTHLHPRARTHARMRARARAQQRRATTAFSTAAGPHASDPAATRAAAAPPAHPRIGAQAPTRSLRPQDRLRAAGKGRRGHFRCCVRRETQPRGGSWRGQEGQGVGGKGRAPPTAVVVALALARRTQGVQEGHQGGRWREPDRRA